MQILRDSRQYFDEILSGAPNVVHLSSHHLANSNAVKKGLNKFGWANLIRALNVANTHNIILHIPRELTLEGRLGFPECPMTAQAQEEVLPMDLEREPQGKAVVFPNGLHCGVSLREGFVVESGGEALESSPPEEIHMIVLHRHSGCLGAARLLQLHKDRAIPVLLEDWQTSRLLLDFYFGMTFDAEPKYKLTATGNCPLVNLFAKILQRRTKLPRQLS